MKTFKMIVSGRVQGVGFRYFTKMKADSLDLKGTVRNLNTGDVEVLVTGEDDRLALFIEFLKKGPSYAVVDNWTLEEMPFCDYFKFEIKI